MKIILAVAVQSITLLSATPSSTWAADANLSGEQVKAKMKCTAIERAEMPPFTDGFSKINQASYKIEFMEDNYPGQVVDGKTYPHPLYGAYALQDYVNAYNLASTTAEKQRYKLAVEQVARAVVCHMDVLSNGGLASYYDRPYITLGQKKFYSALTQAQYLTVMHDASQITKSPALRQATTLILRSLEVPQTDGGVVFKTKEGVSIPQENPGDDTHPPQFVLNGWMEVLNWLNIYHEKSGSPDALKLMNSFGAALGWNIRKYDSPSMRSSLYKLTDVAQLNVLESIGGELEITRARIEIPGVGTYPISASENFDDRLYKNVFYGPEVSLDAEKYRIRNNANAWVWLSLFSDEGNVLELQVKALRDSRFQVQLSVGKPMLRGGGKTDYAWKMLSDEIKLKAGENYTLRLPLSRDDIMAATQPLTTFKPLTINGSQTYLNVYHYVHASQLCQLYRVMQNEQLKKYSIKWEGYTREWAAMPVYNKAGVDVRRPDVALGLKSDSYVTCSE